MTYKVTDEGDTSTVFLDGEIDMDKTEGAKEVIFPLIDAGKNVNLNLSNVQYMDSSGISVLIESHQKALEKNTKVIIKDVSKSVLKVIMMAKLEQIFTNIWMRFDTFDKSACQTGQELTDTWPDRCQFYKKSPYTYTFATAPGTID